MTIAMSAETIRVYRGAPDATLRGEAFVSTCRDFAADYGPVHEFDLRLERVFDSLDPATVSRLLPLDDPWDDVEIETVEDYMARSSDTWSTIEATVRYNPRSYGSVIAVTEGGVLNYLVTDISLLEPVAPSPTP